MGRYGEAWKIRVGAAPEHGRANEALLALLARTLDLPRGDVSLLVGHGSRDKVVALRGLDRVEAERRLAACAETRPARGDG